MEYEINNIIHSFSNRLSCTQGLSHRKMDPVGFLFNNHKVKEEDHEDASTMIYTVQPQHVYR